LVTWLIDSEAKKTFKLEDMMFNGTLAL